MPRLSPNTLDNQLPALFTEELSKPTQEQLFHLVTLHLPEPLEAMLIVDSNYSVKFNGVTYLKFPFKWVPAEINADGSISKTSISIANVSREIMYYVEKYNGLRNCKLVVKTLYSNALDELYTPLADGTVDAYPNPDKDSRAYIEDEFIIDSYTANEQLVSFQLDPVIDLEIRLPRRRYMADSCYFIYGDPDTCAANLASYPLPCEKTLAACRSRNNEANFGGFPGVSGSRRLML